MRTHTLPAAAATPAGESSLSQWQREMRRAQGAALMGQEMLALASYQQALALARCLVAQPPPGRADDCVAALVVARLDLADLLAEAGGVDMAARHRGGAHEALMALLKDVAQDPALQQAALRHSRATHAALMLHLAEHGSHPAIVRALQAGCMAFAVGGGATLH